MNITRDIVMDLVPFVWIGFILLNDAIGGSWKQ